MMQDGSFPFLHHHHRFLAIVTGNFFTIKFCFDLSLENIAVILKIVLKAAKYHLFLSLEYSLVQSKEKRTFKTHGNCSVMSTFFCTCRLLTLRELQRRSYLNTKCASGTWIWNTVRKPSPGTMYQLQLGGPQRTTLPPINYEVLALISCSVRILLYAADSP